MTLIAMPDVMGAISLRLRSFPEILVFVTTSDGYTSGATPSQKAVPRISSVEQSSWNLPKFALLLQGPTGSPVSDHDAAIQALRVDVRCYGPNPFDALRFWRTVNPALCPPPHQGLAESFTIGGCRFYTVDREGGPNRLIEPDTRYPVVIATYVFRFSEIPA
jgi:hypothetical protein